VDDHPVVVEGLATSLRRQPGLDVVGMAGTVAETRTIIDATSPDVVLADVRLPDGSIFEAMRAGGGLPPDGPAWIILSSFDAPQYVATAVRLGAAGYMLKTAPLDDIVDAIERAAAGLLTFTASQMRAIQASPRLSPRELEIVRLMAEGLSNDEIGMRLGIARRTVEKHLSRVFERFDVTTRTELAIRAQREGWLE
jgi:DNA-binding NarL/FixJ family response regulator